MSNLMNRVRTTTLSQPEKPQIAYNTGSLVLSIEQIKLSIYGRTFFGDAEQNDLNESVRMYGVIEPVLVRPIAYPETEPQYTHELIAGYRRMFAAQNCGLFQIEVVERVLDNVQAATLSLSENLQRKNPNPIETGKALANLHDEMTKQLERWMSESATALYDGARPRKLSQSDMKQLATTFDPPTWIEAILERSQSTGRQPKVVREDIGALLALSDSSLQRYFAFAQLPKEIETLVQDGKVGFGHLRNISLLETPEQQLKLAREVARKDLSQSETEQRAKELRAKPLRLLQPTTPALAFAPPLQSLRQGLAFLAETARGVAESEMGGVERANERRELKELIVNAKEAIAQIERALGDASR